jgi:hypothetical protein
MSNNEDDFEIECASEHLVSEYGTEINLILTVLGNIDFDFSNAIVTDESKFADFDLSDEELDELSTEVGANVKHEDHLVQIAKKIRGED